MVSINNKMIVFVGRLAFQGLWSMFLGRRFEPVRPEALLTPILRVSFA